MTSFNGRSITYDAIGNPLSYYNVMHYAFTWEGRQLIRAEIEDDVYTFTYNDEGIRTSKTVNGVTTHYYLDGSQIVAEETEGNITVYLYDLNGSPLGFQYHKATDTADTWEIYWYEKNLLGDIISIYTDVDSSNGKVNRLVTYIYDAYGNFYEEKLYTGVNEAIASNPYTYRGYYYDRDLWFYYLNSRYYDSYTGRFINADSALYHNSSFGYNLFAYCGNNPVNYVDYDGENAAALFWELLTGGSLIAASEPTPIGEVVLAVILVIGSIIIIEDIIIEDYLNDTYLPSQFISQDSYDDSLSSELKTNNDYDPNPYKRAGEKKQNRENRNKSRGKDDWIPRNNRRDGKPAKPKSHTPSKKGHKKYFSVTTPIKIFGDII